MTLTLRFLRWLEFQAQCWKVRCWQEKLRSLVIHSVEDGSSPEELYSFHQLKFIYGEQSQEVQDILRLYRLRQFKLKKGIKQ